jgi:hypothetical protein
MLTIPAKQIEHNRSEPARSSGRVLHLGARYDGKPAANNSHYRGKTERRQKCANPNIFVTAPPSVARSATEDLASYATIPGELRCVQKGVLIGSGRVRKPTANGYPGFAPPDRACIVYCFALGGVT